MPRRDPEKRRLCDRKYRQSEKGKAKRREWCRRFAVGRIYGISSETKLQMFEGQGRACACCREPFAALENALIDHNHITGKIRGLLCRFCNLSANHHMTPERLRKLADYLEKTDIPA